jgi:hypothetical protein
VVGLHGQKNKPNSSTGRTPIDHSKEIRKLSTYFSESISNSATGNSQNLIAKNEQIPETSSAGSFFQRKETIEESSQTVCDNSNPYSLILLLYLSELQKKHQA